MNPRHSDPNRRARPGVKDVVTRLRVEPAQNSLPPPSNIV